MQRRGAFTLIEVLVSIALISLVLSGLYRSLDIQRRSNRHLHNYLQKALSRDRNVMALYRDLLASDGNLTLHKGTFDRLCIQHTAHTLYGIPAPKVCWVVLKEKRELVRIEGGAYRLPLTSDDRVAIDRVMGPMKLFDITRHGGEILVALQAEGEDPYTFLLQGIDPPVLPAKSTPSHPKKKEAR